MKEVIEFLRKLFGLQPRAAAPTGSGVAPAGRFALFGWKLQAPGPIEIKNLDGYTSRYFYLDEQQRMCFWVDCSETGTTPNSNYVRSELRGLEEWRVDAPGLQRLSTTLLIDSRADPDVVTVMQIHAAAPAGGNTPPPLLRVYTKAGALYAAIKRKADGRETEHVKLGGLRIGEAFDCAVEVRAGLLTIAVNGVQQLARTVTFWPHLCHFKTGCYPQANRGEARVLISALDLRLGDASAGQRDD
jgi:hypothetical protein